MPFILVLDASSTLCSVALGDGQQQWHITENQPRRHAQRLLPMVDEVIIQSGLERSQIAGIAYGCGPGSFTGIRIAASVMQGLSMALDIPVVGISSLQAVAQAVFNQTGATEVMAVMDAHMGEVFWGNYQRNGELSSLEGKEKVGSPAEFLAGIHNHSGLIAGDGVFLEPLKDIISQQWGGINPDAQVMLPLALAQWNSSSFSDPEQHQPVYLRDSVAWKKLDEQPSLLKRK